MKPSRMKVRKWAIAILKEHPRQAMLFSNVSEEEVQALAADMERNGQRHPVLIRRDGTIIAGHQRVLAAKRLGWTEIEVIVRDDLDEMGDAAVEAELIGDNLFRRHLSPLARARCIKRLMELEAGGQLNWMKRDELKARIGGQLRMSPRNVSRYLLLLEAPPAIQQALERGEITLIAAGKVALLDKRQKQEIARRIASGEKAKAVVAEYVARPTSRHLKVADAVASLARDLDRGLQDLASRVDEVRAGHVQRHEQTLRKAKTLIGDLMARIEPVREARRSSRRPRHEEEE